MAKKGQLVTKLNGAIEILHRDGRITFRIRSPHQIAKRGTDTILTITNAGLIPYLRDGLSLEIDCMKVGLDVVERADDK